MTRGNMKINCSKRDYLQRLSVVREQELFEGMLVERDA